MRDVQEEGYVGNVQLVEYLQCTPSRRGLPSGLALMVLCAAPASGQSRFSASITPAWLTTLTLLVKVSATVTDYRGHR